MQQDKTTIDLKLPTKWEDLSDKQLRYVFALLAQGYTATEVKAYCLHRWAGLKVLHRYSCACAYFQIAVDVYTDLRLNPDEWE